MVIIIGSCAAVYALTMVWIITGMDGSAKLPADCAMVFGARVYGLKDGRTVAGPGIDRRVSTAVRLFKEGKIKRLFLSGGKGDGFVKSEAQVMGALAQSRGVPASALTLEKESRSTRENLRNTEPLLKECTSIVGISDPYHLRRIEVLAWIEGITMSTIPTDTKPQYSFTVKSLLREALGILYYVTIGLFS